MARVRPETFHAQASGGPPAQGVNWIIPVTAQWIKETGQTRRMDALLDILRKYWGYDSFRPLQAAAMQAVVAGRDSVVVLPTGGGKSLCFQAPALQMPGMAVVVSPLISLMKDQVDTLVDCGVPAACVNSTLTPAERRNVADQVRSGQLKLLYLSPERLMTEQTLGFLQGANLSFIAIDEAHCISDWGHDFRPEYRELRQLKQVFPGIALTPTRPRPPSACGPISRRSWLIGRKFSSARSIGRTLSIASRGAPTGCDKSAK